MYWNILLCRLIQQFTVNAQMRLSKKLFTWTAGNDVVYRAAGDQYLLVEYGPLVLDINLRFRVHALWQWLTEKKIAKNISGIIDITPGIRSLQVHYDNAKLSRNTAGYACRR
jgi:hypothetical protein